MWNIVEGLVLGLAVLVLLFFIGLMILFRAVRRDVEKALEQATTEEQAIIRNKVVKALFPPRFPR